MSLGNELITLEKANLLYKDLRERSAPVIFNTTNGNPAVFSDGANGLPIKSLNITLFPKQEGTGEPSPENIRSILPWERLSVWQAGKNLFNEDSIIFGKWISNSGSVSDDGRGAITEEILVNGNESFTFSCYGSSFPLSMEVIELNASKEFIKRNYATIPSSSTVPPENIHFTASANTRYLVCGVYNVVSADIDSAQIATYMMQLERGTATDYVPYSITEHLITFQSPVYGGVLDIVSGVLTVTHVLWTKNTANMNNESIYPGWKNAEIRDIVGIGKNESIDTALNIGNMVAINTNNANDIVYLPQSEYGMTQEQWIALSLDIQIAIPLATPQEIQLTPTQLRTILGTNTIWSDANSDIEIEYRADTELFLKQNAVKDVQVNGSSILTDGVANIPMAAASIPGVVKIQTSLGIGLTEGMLYAVQASTDQIKAGTNSYRHISPERQHVSAFYALSKAAGVDMAQSSNPVGTYTSAAKHAIQNMIGLSGILGDYESTGTASKAYAIGDTFIFEGVRYRATTAIAIGDVIAPGTNCEPAPIDGHYVRDTDIATADKAGVLKVRYSSDGLFVDNNGRLCISGPTDTQLKLGSNNYRTITPYSQHKSVFFGLAKAANADLVDAQDVTVGQYPQAQKTAIQSMLGIEADIPLVETLTGSTVSITGMPNVRYICDTAISELTITPPASGSIVVRFTAGSNCIVSLPQTVKLPVWFDISSLESGTTYEIIITDGVYGGVMSWAD